MALRVSTLFLVAAAALSRPVAAQQRAVVPIEVKPGAPADSQRVRYHDTLRMLRDTVGSVRGALGQLGRDARGVSRETVLSRAKALTDRCRATQRALQAHESLFDPAHAPARPPRLRTVAANLVQAMRALRASLDAECLRGFALEGPGQRADTLRAWAGFHAGRIDQALTRYDQAVADFAGAAEIRLEPALPKR